MRAQGKEERPPGRARSARCTETTTRATERERSARGKRARTCGANQNSSAVDEARVERDTGSKKRERRHRELRCLPVVRGEARDGAEKEAARHVARCERVLIEVDGHVPVAVAAGEAGRVGLRLLHHQH